MAIYYLSQLLGLPVRDRLGEKIALVKDLIVRFGTDYPPVIGLMARSRRRNFFISRDQITDIGESKIQLSTYKLDLQPFSRRAGEILLARDVLDKQIIDINGRRVVRVNDVQLAPIGEDLRLMGVDVNFKGFLRRLLPKKLLYERKTPEIIDWANVEYLATEAPTVKLNVSHKRIAKLHPVEIAKLIETLSYKQEAEIISALDLDRAADALEEMSTERQADIINRMDEEEAAQLLDHMAPDEAADLLADLSEEKAKELLDRMSPEESEDVRELLEYEKDTAGGLMTSEFVAIPVDLTVGETIEHLRALPWKPEMIHDLYLVDNETDLRLLGIISLRDLVLASPNSRLRGVMINQIISVTPDIEALEVVRKIAEYNLFAIPVLDDEHAILGIVTVDDAIALLLPKDERRHVFD
jgi:magnesium transporter